MYPDHHCVSGLSDRVNDGEDEPASLDLDPGLEFDRDPGLEGALELDLVSGYCCALSLMAAFDEALCDCGSTDDWGVYSPVLEMVESLRGRLLGRNKSRVSSRISEPMASIAKAYLSLRILDSLTMNSAKIRTLSVSVVALASLCTNISCLSAAARAKPSPDVECDI